MSDKKICPYCGGKGQTEVTKYLPTAKMQKIMKKYKLSQLETSKILSISQAGVNNWFKPKTNVKGIKEKYFKLLYKKGYK